MRKNNQRELLDKNYDELKDKNKDTLLLIGEKLLSIQNLTNKGKKKSEDTELKNE